jgi:REP element-mobilizing transposase RayT
MTQPLSIENKDWIVFITTRTAQSRLWFINNKSLERDILSCLARYQAVYMVEIFGFILMGNHYHLIARFPHENRASFMRDFNAAVARLVSRYYHVKGRRSVWARRYAYQILPEDFDTEHWYLYLVTNPVSSGIVDDIARYPSYCSHQDLVTNRTRSFLWTDWSAYCLAKRTKRSVKLEEFQYRYELYISRLPKHRKLSLSAFAKIMSDKIRSRTFALIAERKKARRGFLGRQLLLLQKIGSFPRTTKESTRQSKRPVVLSVSVEAKKRMLQIYRMIKNQFLYASWLFRSGSFQYKFPPGTYMPTRYAKVT